jgi:hypothetical protein
MATVWATSRCEHDLSGVCLTESWPGRGRCIAEEVEEKTLQCGVAPDPCRRNWSGVGIRHVGRSVQYVRGQTAAGVKLDALCLVRQPYAAVVITAKGCRRNIACAIEVGTTYQSSLRTNQVAPCRWRWSSTRTPSRPRKKPPISLFQLKCKGRVPRPR